MTTILIKKKDTAGAPAAGDLTNAAGGAEIAVNTATKRIYTKDSGGNVVETGTNPSILNVDNIQIDVNTISSTDTNGNINLTPNGTGSVVISKLNVTGAITFDGNVTVGNSSSDTLTINSTITSNLIFTDNTYDIGASGATRPRNLYLGGLLTMGGALTVNGNATLGDATTDTVTVNGYMGVGAAASSPIGLTIGNSALTGPSQYGVTSGPTSTSAATSITAAFNAQPATAASAYTSSDVIGYRVGTFVKGAGSTITNLHGVYITDRSEGTNNYGITSLVSSGANKWNIYASGTAQNYFAGDVTLGNGATLKIDDQDSITFGTFSAGTTGVLLQGGTSTSFLAYQAGKERMALGTTEVVFNDPANDVDFRVESDNNGYAFFVDAGNDQVVVGSSTPATGSASNIPFYVAYSSGPGVRFYSNVGASRAATCGISLVTYGASKFSGYQTTTNGGGMWVSSSSATSTYITGGSTAGVVYLGNFNQDPFENTSVAFVEYANFNSTEIVFNETSRDQDFRVESDGQSHAFFVDAGNNAIGINTSNPTTNNPASVRLTMGSSDSSSRIQQNVNGGGAIYGGTDTVNNPTNGFKVGHVNGTDRFEIAVGTNDGVLDARATSLTVNQLSADQDFIVESDSYANMLFVDAGLNRVGFGTSSPVAVLDTPNLSNSNYPITRFSRDRASRIHVFSTGASTKTVTIDITDFGLTGFLAYVDVSGHNATNGNDFWYDRYVWRLMEESGSTRINTRCTNYEFASGTSRVGSPTASFPGGGQSRITFTVTAGYDTKIWVKLESVGADQITSISVA